MSASASLLLNKAAPAVRSVKSSTNRPNRRVTVCAQPTETASRRARRQENVAGPFWVDNTCIDCDTCRWMAPDVYQRIGDKSAVMRQPAAGSSDEAAALRAITACPTGSIHYEDASVPKGTLHLATHTLALSSMTASSNSFCMLCVSHPCLPAHSLSISVRICTINIFCHTAGLSTCLAGLPRFPPAD